MYVHTYICIIDWCCYYHHHYIVFVLIAEEPPEGRACENAARPFIYDLGRAQGSGDPSIV